MYSLEFHFDCGAAVIRGRAFSGFSVTDNNMPTLTLSASRLQFIYSRTHGIFISMSDGTRVNFIFASPNIIIKGETRAIRIGDMGKRDWRAESKI